MAEIVIKLVNGELAGKTMQGLNKELREAKLAADKATAGTQAWIDAHSKLDKVKSLQVDLKKQIEGTTQASDLLKKSWNNLPGAQYFNQAVDSFGMMKKGVGGLITQFGVLKTAIAATGIGLLVLAVGALYTLFKNFTPVIDKVEQVLGGLGGVIDEIVNRWLNFAEGYLKFITGDFKAGMKQMVGSFDDLGNSIKGAYNAGTELAKLQQDLDDRNRGIVISNAEAERSIERLIIQSKNRTLAEKERLALLDEAERIAKKHFEKENQLEIDNLELLMGKARAKSKLNDDEILQLAEGTLAQDVEYKKRGQLGDNLLKEIADQKAKVINLEGKTNNLLEKVNNQRDKLNEAREVKAAKAAEERAKKSEKDLADELKRINEEAAARANIESLKIDLMDEGLQKRLALVDQDYAKRMQAVEGNEEQVLQQLLLLEQKKAEAIQQAKEQFAREQAAKDLQAKTAQADLDLATDLNILNEKRLALQIDDDLYKEQAAQLAIINQQAKLDFIRAAHGEESAEYQRAYSLYLQLQQAQADASVSIKKKEMEDQMAALDGALGTFGNFFGTLASFHAQGTAQWKKFAIAQAIMSTIQSSINAYQSTAAIPIVGPVLAPAAAALALAAGYQNVRKIEATKAQPPTKAKAEHGGFLIGPRHSEGGIPIEAEGGEFIFSRKAVQALGVVNLTKINERYTKQFEAGGPIDFNGSSPSFEKADLKGSRSIFGQIDKRIDGLEDFAERVDQWAKTLRVENVVTETQDKIKVINKIQAEADV